MASIESTPSRLRGLALALAANGFVVFGSSAGAQPVAAPVSPTVVVLPVLVPYALVKPALDAAFPVETDRENEWREGRPLADGSKLRYQVYFFRGAASFAVEAGDLVVRFDEVQYRLRAEITRPSGRVVAGGCGYGEQWPRRARLLARSALAWGEGWRFTLRTAFAPPELRDPCRLEDGTDLGPALEQGLAASLDAAATALDRGFAERAAERARFAGLWKALDRPVEIVPGAWLEMRPSDAAAGPIDGDAEGLRSSVALTLAPRVIVGPAPPAGGTEPPPLRLGAPGPSGMNLQLPVVASFEEVTRRLQGDLLGTEIPVLPGRSLRIVSVSVAGAGPALAIDLGLADAVEGIAHVVGRPQLEAGGAVVRFTDLRATVETSGRLARAMSGVTEKALVLAVESYARIDLGDHLENVRRGLAAALNRQAAPGLWLQGEVDPPRVESFGPVAGGLEIRLRVEARPRVEVR